MALPRKGMRLVAEIAAGERIVAMEVHDFKIFVATDRRLFVVDSAHEKAVLIQFEVPDKNAPAP